MPERMPKLIKFGHVVENTAEIMLRFDEPLPDHMIKELTDHVALKFAGQIRLTKDENKRTPPPQPGTD